MFAALFLSVLIFDLDDTLISTNNSIGIALAATLSHYTNEKYDLQWLKNERGKELSRDDMVFAQNFLKIKDIEASYEEITKVFEEKYQILGAKEEKMIVDLKILEELKQDHDLYILTDRPRKFYDSIWKDKLSPYFKDVVCYGDYPNLTKEEIRKPNPTILYKMMETYNIKNPVYIGNGLKDMELANNAGITAIGITTTSEQNLTSAGAECVLNSVNKLPVMLKSVRKLRR